MFIQIDELEVPVQDWTGVLRGDHAARVRVAKLAANASLRTRALMQPREGVTLVSIRQLEQYALIGGLTLAPIARTSRQPMCGGD